MMNNIEGTIFSQLINNESYTRKVLPFLKEEYFQEEAKKTLFKLIKRHIDKYNTIPTKEILLIELGNTEIHEKLFNDINGFINTLEYDSSTKMDWLIDTTEKYCQDKAIYNAIHESIKIIDNKSTFTKNAIPKILQDALQVSFNTTVGHDFIEDSDIRYDIYHKKENKVGFDLDYFNKITNDGFSEKSLNIFASTTGVGKTMVMCHMAAHNLMCNKNVLYITMEMAEERIAQRIDTNLMNVTFGELNDMSKLEYDKKMNAIRKTTKGKLIIKEYPTASAGSASFRNLINELRIKKNFVPDIVYVDYLNLCLSSRIKSGVNVNSYSYIKAITEEIRGLAVEFKLPIVSATQLNRAAQGASDVGLENTSDSMGIGMTADFMAALITTEELDEINQIMVKQLKNRYGDPSINRKFVIGVDRSRMRLYNVEQSAQENLTDGPVFDSTAFGDEEFERNRKVRFDRTKFEGFR